MRVSIKVPGGLPVCLPLLPILRRDGMCLWFANMYSRFRICKDRDDFVWYPSTRCTRGVSVAVQKTRLKRPVVPHAQSRRKIPFISRHSYHHVEGVTHRFQHFQHIFGARFKEIPWATNPYAHHTFLFLSFHIS